jgi:uncharacterized repeat protein (TIGR01451 family)
MNPVKEKSRDSRGYFHTKTSFAKIPAAIALILFFIPLHSFAACVCCPTSAQLCAAVDDYATIYLNGTLIDNFDYVNWDQTGVSPKCEMLTGAQLALIQDTGNILAMVDLNTNCCEIWASWSLDITCTGGGHSYLSSNETQWPASMYRDTDACGPTTPAKQGALNWYDGLWNQATSGLPWGNPVIVTGTTWGKRIWDPGTGNPLPVMGWSSGSGAATGDCQQLFFRQPFSITVSPTPMPPNFTMSKTVTMPVNGSHGNEQITFNLHICNSGGGTRGNPLNITDTWTMTPDSWQFQGFIFGGSNVGFSYDDPTFGHISEAAGPPVAFNFEVGFPGLSCYDLSFVLQTWNPTTQCITWHNNATLNYTWVPVQTVVSTVNIPDFCPTPTITPLPPVLAMVKSASPTTNINNGTAVSFNLHFCNTGGILMPPDQVTIVDDYSSSTDNWQYDGPYYTGNPATGIASFSTSTAGHTTTYVITFQSPGFTGCVDMPMNMHMTSAPVDCAWFNKATLQSYHGLPVVVSTVNMSNWCPSPTSTVTISPTSSRTPTNTITPTRTMTPTYTLTATPTLSQPTMSITKTANVASATFGDTITWTLTYCNIGLVAASNIPIYDTIPAQLTYAGCTGGCTVAGSLITWTIAGPVNPTICGSVTWWGQITSYPFNPLFRMPYYTAECNDREFLWVLSCQLMPAKNHAGEILLE